MVRVSPAPGAAQAEQIGADLKRVAFGERAGGARGDAHAVEESAVAGAEILDEVLAVLRIQMSVLPADLLTGQGNIAFGIAAQNGAAFANRKLPPRLWPAQNDNCAHALVLPDDGAEVK